MESVFSGSIWSGLATSSNFFDVTFSVWEQAHFYPDKYMGTNGIFASIARSLTEYVRTATNGIAEGSTHQLVPYIKARWWFMIPPLVMVILNSGLVSATTLQSRRRGISSWKTSALANMLTDYYTQNAGAARQLTHHVVMGPDGYDRLSHLNGWAGIRTARLRQEGESTCSGRSARGRSYPWTAMLQTAAVMEGRMSRS